MKSFATLTTKQKSIATLRWFCVLPAAVFGNFVGYYFGGALGLLAQTAGIVNPPSDDSSSNRLLRYLIWMFPVGVMVVVASAKTAPCYRLAVASLVAVLWILWTDRIHGFQGPTVIATGVSAGCGVACVFVLERWKRTPV